MRPGHSNLLTDVAGLRVGHAHDAAMRTGATVMVADRDNVCAVHVMGGAPGTRDTDLLAPENTVESVDALFLSGGSAFGLDAGGGAQAALAAMGRGFPVGAARVPIVPGAIVFDLADGAPWTDEPPYRGFGRAAVEDASEAFALGSVGAGIGATVGHDSPRILRGGVGSASAVLSDGAIVAALVVVNAVGSPADGPRLRAARFERDGEFGGLGTPHEALGDTLPVKLRAAHSANTTIGIVATDATLTKAQAKRLATVAHDGFAHALWPAHTPMDGDLLFALSTKARPAPGPAAMLELGATAAAVVARAIARGVWEATPCEDGPPSFRQVHGLA